MSENKGIHDGHRNRVKKRFVESGLDNFFDHQVLELMLFYCIPRKDTNDMALVDLLGLLIEIAKKNMDVRVGISYFKEDIISRVTSNIFRRVQI